MRHAVSDYNPPQESAAANLKAITHALERMVARHHLILKAEGAERQVQNLKFWLDNNRKDFAVSGTFPEPGNVWLSGLCKRLKLAVEERQRLEDEGGTPATKEQNEQNEELLNIIRCIEKIAHPTHS